MKHQYPLITAHSGCEGTADNSMASIEAAIALGADCAEIDVHVDGGGRLWLTHDAPERFDGLATLEEAFARVRESGIGVNCDIKRHAVLYPTLALAERVGVPRDQLILSGAVGVQLLREDAGIARRARVFLNSEELAAELLHPSAAKSRDLVVEPLLSLGERYGELSERRLDKVEFLRARVRLHDRGGDGGLEDGLHRRGGVGRKRAHELKELPGEKRLLVDYRVDGLEGVGTIRVNRSRRNLHREASRGAVSERNGKKLADGQLLSERLRHFVGEEPVKRKVDRYFY